MFINHQIQILQPELYQMTNIMSSMVP